MTHELANEPVFQALLRKSELASDIRDVAEKRLAGESWKKWGGVTTGESPQKEQPPPDSIFCSPQSDQPSLKKPPVWGDIEPPWPLHKNVPMTFLEQVNVPCIAVSERVGIECLGAGTLFVFHVHELTSEWSEYQQAHYQSLLPIYGILWADAKTLVTSFSVLSQGIDNESGYSRDLSHASEREICRGNTKDAELSGGIDPTELDAKRRFTNNLNHCLKEHCASECQAFTDSLFSA